MNGQNNKMTTGISALVLGKQGRHEDGRSGVIMQELTGYQLVQLAVFPDQMHGFARDLYRRHAVLTAQTFGQIHGAIKQPGAI